MVYKAQKIIIQNAEFTSDSSRVGLKLCKTVIHANPSFITRRRLAGTAKRYAIPLKRLT